jgi:replication factor C large subunit
MKPWTEKHRPKTFEEVKGQDEAIKKIKDFLENFNIGNLTRKQKKALLLHGTPGTGKTTLAHVSAYEYNAEIFELNASDFRNKEKINEILRPAMEQMSLTKKTKIILVDEADGISGYQDRGGITELISLIESSKFPIIITANDAWSQKLSPLRKNCEIVEIKEIDYKIIREVLEQILKKENKVIEHDSLTKISVKSAGDLRAAINDLQTISEMINSDYENIEFDQRNKELDIFNALKKIFQQKPTEELLGIYDKVNMPLDEIFLWIEENIPYEYKGRELAKAYDKLSRADVFKGRIYKQQYWRFLVYENILLSYGISASKKDSKYGFTKYKKPTRILKIWMNNQRTAKKKSIAEKYAKIVHVGQKRAMYEFPIIKQIINSNQKIAKELKLSEEEIEYLRN